MIVTVDLYRPYSQQTLGLVIGGEAAAKQMSGAIIQLH